MEVQRDAVKYICETLEVPYPEPKELDAIGIIRSDAIGHAMYGKPDRVSKSSFIQRFDMSRGSSQIGESTFIVRSIWQTDERPADLRNGEAVVRRRQASER